VRRPALVLAIAAAACSQPGNTLPPAGQLLVYLDTDAILPPGTTRSYGPLDSYPLFDHVRFDVFANGVLCESCTRDFDIDAALIDAGRLSFAVLPSPGKTGVLRARLFRFGNTQGAEPRPESTIDAYFAVGGIPAEGIQERTILLKTQDVGTVQGGLAAPLAMAPGRPATFHAGTWPLGARVDCPAPPSSGEVCIPGGAFWMGSPLESRILAGSGSQRLVVLSPYYLDAHEVTVGEFRKSGLHATPILGGTGTSVDDYCRFTKQPGDYEDFPVNCVTAGVARAYCQGQGGGADLPTEAQYEYAASALRSAPYVWGTDPPTCAGVVMCQKSDLSPVGLDGDDACKASGAFGGPLKVGSGTLDRLTLPTGTVIDLMGNVGEYARDEWNRLVEPCWSHGGVYVDPLCTTPSQLDPPPVFALRGGNWIVSPYRASGRYFATAEGPLVGFRCAHPVK
jgi:formylglycine-generating enzyme required for sulfatase activity